MKKLSLLLILSLSLLSTKIKAQNYDFGKVSIQELQELQYPLDSTAPAAILYKNIKIYYEYSNASGFSLVTEVQERIKIYKKEGFNWAEKGINTYQNDGIKERITIKGSTYNLDSNGKIVKEKLNDKAIFKEIEDENWIRNKFAMPNVQLGSVVEWSYRKTSPFAGYIDDLIFQYEIPVKKMEVKVSIPEYYVFKYLPSFYYPITVVQSQRSRTIQYSNKSSNSVGSQTFVDNHTVSINEIVYNADEINIPAIKVEPYINYIGNYGAKVVFEHTSTQFPGEIAEYYSTDWESVAKSIFNNYYFGKQLEGINFLKADVDNQIAGLTAPEEKANKLFNFIKTQIKWNGSYGKYADKDIKRTYQEHEGNVGAVNLTLIAMFRLAGLQANPVLISTKTHGIPLFPTLNGFNYVIAAVELPSGVALFDATEIYSTPNVLPNRALNWSGRLVKDDGTSTIVDLFSIEPAKERTNIYIKMDETGKVTGLKRSTYSNNYALDYRKNKAFLTESDLIPIIEKSNKNIEISEFKILHKDDLYKPIVESFKFEADNMCDVIADKIYFSPLFILAENTNPFTLDKRLYPIDFGTAFEKSFFVTIEIPTGFAITTLPQNIAIGLPKNMGYFKFEVSKSGTNKIDITSLIKINTPVFSATEYDVLKLFYKQLIDKQIEKVELTKV